MHDALRHLLINTYDYHNNCGVIMMITIMTFFIIAQHYIEPKKASHHSLHLGWFVYCALLWKTRLDARSHCGPIRWDI